jgi:trk system potassium uptake protein TrkH
LIVVGTLGTLGLEWNRAFAGMDFPTRISWSLFHSVNCRTAGFNTFDVGALQPSTLLLSIGLMIIGGSPGSMAGGLKTVTFAVLVLTTWSALRRRDEVQVGDRRLPRTAVGVAILIAMLTVAILFMSILLLLVLEAGQPAAATHNHWLGLVFEAVSAFATVGLSSGVTPLLTPAGKLVIIGLMFLGRVLPLVLAFHLTRPPIPWRVRHPIEDITLG